MELENYTKAKLKQNVYCSWCCMNDHHDIPSFLYTLPKKPEHDTTAYKHLLGYEPLKHWKAFAAAVHTEPQDFKTLHFMYNTWKKTR